MATNNTFRFSEDCNNSIHFYLSLFTFIIQDFKKCKPNYPDNTWNYDLKDGEEALIWKLKSEVLFKPEALPGLLLLRNKLSNLLMQTKAVAADFFEFETDLYTEDCINSLRRVIAVVDNEINDIESLQDDEIEDVVTCSTEPSNEPETDSDKPVTDRESWQFDVTSDFKDSLDKLFYFLADSVIKVEDYDKDFATFRCCLFGGDVYKEHMIKLQPKGIKGIACFFGAMRESVDYYNNKATFKYTICKWFVNSKGGPLTRQYIQDNTNRDANTVVWDYVKGLFPKKDFIKGRVVKEQ